MNNQVCIAGGHLMEHHPRLAIQMNNEWGKSHDLGLFSSSVFFRVIIATFPLKSGSTFPLKKMAQSATLGISQNEIKWVYLNDIIMSLFIMIWFIITKM